MKYVVCHNNRRFEVFVRTNDVKFYMPFATFGNYEDANKVATHLNALEG